MQRLGLIVRLQNSRIWECKCKNKYFWLYETFWKPVATANFYRIILKCNWMSEWNQANDAYLNLFFVFPLFSGRLYSVKKPYRHWKQEVSTVYWSSFRDHVHGGVSIKLEKKKRPILTQSFILFASTIALPRCSIFEKEWFGIIWFLPNPSWDRVGVPNYLKVFWKSRGSFGISRVFWVDRVHHRGIMLINESLTPFLAKIFRDPEMGRVYGTLWPGFWK